MQYLLDTHIFLWWLNDDDKLDKPTKDLIINPENQVFVSVVSAWEMSIKQNTGKLSLKTTIQKSLDISGFSILDIKLEHVLELDKLPMHHRDPFDRMLIAQAKVEKLSLISDDVKMEKYGVR